MVWREESEVTDNPLMKTVILGAFTTAFGIAMIFGPGLIGISGFDGGFAISFVGIIVATLGVIIATIYLQQANILNGILGGEGRLAHWTFEPEMWKEYTQKEYVEEIAEKKGLFLVVSAFALFFGVLFWVLDNEAGFFVFIMMLGLIGLVGFTWQFSAWYYRKNNERGVREAYIARSGVYMNRRLYAWRSSSARLLNARIENTRGLSVLKFNYTAFTFPAGQTYTVRVPIPVGQEEIAKTIVQELNS
jgi:MFS family permease